MTPNRRTAPRALRSGSFWSGVMLAIVLTSLTAAMMAAMRLRGPWYDEFYTLYVTRPGIPLPLALDRWLADNHPPLFYALVRATAWLGATVEARRIVNLLIFVAAGAQILWWLRAPPLRRIGWVYAIALAAAWPAINRAAELRSNYLAFASAAVAVAALIACGQRRDSQGRSEWAMLTLALLVAFNVHLAASIILGGLVGTLLLRHVLARDWRQAIRLGSAAVLAGLPMFVHLALSFGRIEANTRGFWIQGGFDSARWAIQTEIVRNLTANPPVTLAAVIGFALLGWQGWHRKAVPSAVGRAITLASGLGLACVLMVMLHLWRPFIIDRYLVALHPPLAMILALGAAALLDHVRRLFALLIALAMMLAAQGAIHANLGRTLARPSWYGTGRLIAAIVHACPATRVHADLNGNRPVLATPPSDNARVIPFAYRTVAARWGFPLADPGDHRMAQDCPTLFWTEHVAGESASAQRLAAPLRAAGFPIARVRLIRIGDGHVLLAWPSR